jgi:protein SCO1/2
MTLNKLNIIYEQLKKDQNKLKIFFISIDPERDTPEVMKDYLSSFGDQFIGITGEPEKIFALSKSWGIIKEKIFTEDGNYTLNHSSPIILLKDGKYVATIRQQDDIKKSLKKIKKYL